MGTDLVMMQKGGLPQGTCQLPGQGDKQEKSYFPDEKSNRKYGDHLSLWGIFRLMAGVGGWRTTSKQKPGCYILAL